MTIIRWLVGSLLFVALLFLSLQNSELVTLRFYHWFSWQAPLIFVVPRIYSTLHPDPIINTRGKVDMDPLIRWCFLSMLVGFTFLFSWLQSLRVRLARLERRVAA